MKSASIQRLTIATVLSSLSLMPFGAIALALPPAEDVPEEVLRTQIILDARSPIDGKPMTPADYATLQTQQQTPYEPPPQLSPQVRGVVTQLRLRRFIKRFLPFIPIK